LKGLASNLGCTERKAEAVVEILKTKHSPNSQLKSRQAENNGHPFDGKSDKATHIFYFKIITFKKPAT